MMLMQTMACLVLLILCCATTVKAQKPVSPKWQQWHYLSEKEMKTPVRAVEFVETAPPTGLPRFVAEFEPMQGVMIRYPLGIPTTLVVQMASVSHVYCIVSSALQKQAKASFENAGVDMECVSFVNAETDSYWVRDYGPWYSFEDRHPAIVDNVYNRSSHEFLTGEDALLESERIEEEIMNVSWDMWEY